MRHMILREFDLILIALKFLFFASFYKINLINTQDDPLPGCESFNNENCQQDSQFHANEGVNERRWQTPKPGSKGYQPSYQHYYALVGYADIKYIDNNRNVAEICIIPIHKFKNVTFQYFFNDIFQSNNCKRFDTSFKSDVRLLVKASDNTQLEIDPVIFKWNNQPIANRPGDFRNGQKGAIVELFGWKYVDVEKECQIIAKSGYLGLKLTPVHEHLMSTEPISNTINPWYYMYQPVSFKLNSRSGTRDELIKLINTCRKNGVRVYIDVVINHFTGMGNDLNHHRNSDNGCVKWGNKTSSGQFDQQSPFYTHAYTFNLNPNTEKPPSNEFPAAAIGPEDFHCQRPLNRWDDLFILNNGWLVGLTDLDTSKENVRERLASYLVELLSIGASGFRIDAAKHISPDDLSAILKKVQTKMGGNFPDDFIVWLEIVTGGEANLLWDGPSWYGHNFNSLLLNELGSQTEIDKIKIYDGLYPKRAWDNHAVSKNRIVILNDDHDSQMPGFDRDIIPNGCVLNKNCSIDQHRFFEIKLFENPYGVENNNDDWPIRIILSSYYLSFSTYGVPDGFSDCKLCLINCEACKESTPYIPAYVPGECGYVGKGYTKVHRDIKIINAMRKWMGLNPISGADIGLPNCE